MQNFMQLDEKAASEAGVGGGISTSGPYQGTITNKMVTAQTGAKGVEFSLATPQGDANYLTLYYQKAGGDQNPVGFNALQAIMYCCGVASTRIDRHPIPDDNGEQQYYIPELENKKIGLVLQKILYSKDGGGEGYKFDIIMPFKYGTNQTAIEIQQRDQPALVDKICANLQDKDKREKPTGNIGYETHISNATASRPVSKFDAVNQAQQGQQLQADDFPY